jgi:hypothetical protein
MSKPDVVYVVLCRYDGCDECSSGAHVVGVFSRKPLAEAAERKHDSEEDSHLHSFFTDTIECNMNWYKDIEPKDM